MSIAPVRNSRVTNALKTQFVADALAMPVHWYYNPLDIEKAFPRRVQKFEAAPEVPPSSRMSLHATRPGGRPSGPIAAAEPQLGGGGMLSGRESCTKLSSVP